MRLVQYCSSSEHEETKQKMQNVFFLSPFCRGILFIYIILIQKNRTPQRILQWYHPC